MVLSDRQIRRALTNNELVIEPFQEANLNPAGYDLSLCTAVNLKPGEQRLVATREKVELGRGIVGFLHIRSSLAREGIFSSLALVDPGFRGQLTISLFNSGRKAIRLRSGEKFIQLTLLRLGKPAATKYHGRYQDSSGVVYSRR
jgi:deoxycytidine triphosphate deaminase